MNVVYENPFLVVVGCCLEKNARWHWCIFKGCICLRQHKNDRTKIGHVAFVHTATRVRIQQYPEKKKHMRKSKATESKMTQMIPCLLTWEEDSHLFPTLSWHGGWSNWWDLQLNISDPSKKPYFVLKNLVLDRIDVRVSHLNTGNLVWGGSYFFANRVGRYIPRKLKGGGIFHGSPKIPKIGKRETIKKNMQFGVFQTLPPPSLNIAP